MSPCRLQATWARKSEWAPWILAAFVALAAGPASDGLGTSIEQWIGGDRIGGWVLCFRTVWLLAFFGGAYALYRFRGALFRPSTRFLRKEVPEKREHLVLYLSDLRSPFVEGSRGLPDGFTPTGNLDGDLNRLADLKASTKRKWPWEMPLRGIRHHLGRLRSITILCSRESILQSAWFLTLLEQYAVLQGTNLGLWVHEGGESTRTETADNLTPANGWDFEDFDHLSRATLHLVRYLKRSGADDKQIMIDFTGGQKVTSVVAAAITFNRTIKAQYVQTNPPWNVTSYDITYGSAETGGLGL